MAEEKQSLEQVLDFEGEWSGGHGFLFLSCVDPGTFNMSIKLKQDGTFTGTTNDDSGVADVEGELKNNHIKFTKTYIRERSKPEAMNGSIIYEGRLIGSRDPRFEGKWCPESDYGNKNKAHYGFTLRRKTWE
ncbi:hypothetical protein GOV06_03555 [Candidatus Woesearchaeota archaeon]|nr:hypothetical protein [Candidatus Woesearchaeota archaeon]